MKREKREYCFIKVLFLNPKIGLYTNRNRQMYKFEVVRRRIKDEKKLFLFIYSIKTLKLINTSTKFQLFFQ